MCVCVCVYESYHISYMMNIACFLQQLTQNEGTNSEVSNYQEDDLYEEGNLNPMSSKNGKTC